MIKLHSLTAESPPTEPCVTFQNKYSSPSALGGNTGRRADTDAELVRLQKTLFPRDKQVCQPRCFPRKEHDTQLPGKAGRVPLLSQPSVPIYRSSATLICSFCLSAQEKTHLSCGLCFQGINIAASCSMCRHKRAQIVDGAQCLLSLSIRPFMFVLMMLISKNVSIIRAQRSCWKFQLPIVASSLRQDDTF